MEYLFKLVIYDLEWILSIAFIEIYLRQIIWPKTFLSIRYIANQRMDASILLFLVKIGNQLLYHLAV